MILLIPLAIFLVLCIFMIVLLTKSTPPDSIATVEALCDSIIRGDKQIRSELSMVEIPSEVVSDIVELSDFHKEIGASYNAKIVDEYVDESSNYNLVEVPLLNSRSKILFLCKFAVNQWTVASVDVQ